MRRAAGVVLFAVLLPAAPANAGCPAPEITVPNAVVAGEDLVVTGDFFAAECNDAGMGCVAPRRSPPMTGVTVALAGSFDTVTMEVVDAAEDYSLAATLPVPADLEPGAYEVIVSVEGGQGFLDTETVEVRRP